MSSLRKPFGTIGVRLTVSGTLMFTVVSLVLCGALYTGMNYTLLRELDSFLHAEVEELGAKVSEHAGDLAAAEQAIQRELAYRPRRDLIYRLLDADGRVLITSLPRTADSGVQQLDWYHVPHSTEIHYQTIRLPNAPARFRVCTEPIEVGGRAGLISQALYTLETVDYSLAVLRRYSAIGLAGAMLLAFLASWFLARRMLRPVSRMTQTAQRIGAAQVGARLPRSGTGDELDRLAETLNEMLARIESHVQRVREFSADASHELRTPLSALRGMAEVALTRERTAAELREVIETSLEQYGRLQKLAEDLLLLARADAEVAGLKKGPVRLNDVICDVAELYRPLAEESGLTLDVAAEVSATVLGDGGRLRQMLGNLVDNSIKFSPEPGRIELALSSCDGTATIVVRDAGQGIAPADIARVFDRFYRVDSARATKGSGLGLAISRWIAEAHGGKIRIASALREGTTVTISLPTTDEREGESGIGAAD
ncbi:MAG: ATP-binding protein [Planctomycetota bacterium]